MAVGISLVDSETADSISSAWSVSGLSTGVAAADRLVFAVVTIGSTNNVTITSATIDGSAANLTIVQDSSPQGRFMSLAIIWRLVASGTSTTIATTYSGGDPGSDYGLIS